ncbi:hypothetical protein F2Q69_00007309 [Brassica cretica]|uniref:Uncharacterized protein n=1 Tax=Brassica cretica TaxID=69181 RepID=A0A8S9PHI6_BRACR|nr:hypothetical protein F2Q69_00007309 [Brassica cretica]
MSSSQNEKKNSDVAVGEASLVLPIPAIHEATSNFIAEFLSFKERLSRRNAEKETSRTYTEMSSIPFDLNRRKQVSERCSTPRRNRYGTCASSRGLGPTFGLFHYPGSDS